MSERYIRARYDVFCGDSTSLQPNPLSACLQANEHVLWTRVYRNDDPNLFRPPIFGIQGNADLRRRAMPQHAEDMGEAVARASVCYVIDVDAEAQDLAPLRAAILLAEGTVIAHGGRAGIVVDRTSGIGYTAVQFSQLSTDLVAFDGLEIRDMVVIREHRTGQSIRLRTEGMCKFGQQDFLIAAFPADLVEIARRLLLENLCRSSLAEGPIRPGQVMRYGPTHLTSQLHFIEDALGRLIVTDGHRDTQTGLPGLEYFLMDVQSGLLGDQCVTLDPPAPAA